MDILPQLIINGIIAGSIYALAALGLTLIFGVLGFVNFAYGDMIIVGAYLYFVFLVLLGIPWFVSVPLAVASLVIIALVLERTTFRPVRNADPMTPLIISVGVAFALRSLLDIIFKSNLRTFTTEISEGIPILSGMARVTSNQLLIIGLSLISILALFLFLKYTKIGKAIRAVSDNRMVAEILGINVNRYIKVVFAISAILACIAGILIGYENYLLPTRGVTVGIKAFAAIIFGGVGSLPGALLGGFIIGLGENILPGLDIVSTGYKDSIAFFILIIIMLIRPRGLFGISKSEGTDKE